MDYIELGEPLITLLLVFHDVLATALLLAISWQTLTAWWPSEKTDSSRNSMPFVTLTLRDAVTGLFVAVIGIGAFLYPSYRFVVRPYLEFHDMRGANGVFELKEHFAALALLSLPAYRASWHMPMADNGLLIRRAYTTLLCTIVWWNFVIGHVMNYIIGLSP